MTRLRRLALSILHTRPRQVVERARLTVKRRAARLAAPVLPLGRRLRAEPWPALRADLPAPLFAPRTHLVARDGHRPYGRILERSVSLVPRIDWRWPRDLPGVRLDRLTLHYHEWAEGLGDDELRHAVLDWIESNPPYGEGYWNDAWNSYALSIRTTVWLQQIAARRDRLTAELTGRLARSIAAQLRFLMTNLELDIGGNHLVRNVKALLWAARSFEGAEAAAWGACGVDLLLREVLPQVLPDGLHFERSPAYHAQVTGDLLECLSVVPEGSARDRLRETVDRMAQALADLTHPDGTVSLFNDGGTRMGYAPAEVLGVHRRLGGGWVTPRAVAALRDAGYFTARSEEDMVVVDCGKLGPDELPAHAHGDALAFEWSVAGRPLVVDAGVYEYQGPLRPWSRATRSHNTVTVDDLDQAEFWGAFRMARRPRVVLDAYEAVGAGFRLAGHHDGYAHLAGSPVHERAFTVEPHRIAVEDRVRGGAGQTVRARLLLHPDVSVERRPDGAILAWGPARARLRTSASMFVEPALHAPDFGVKRDTRQIVLDYGRAPASGAFTLERVRW